MALSTLPIFIPERVTFEASIHPEVRFFLPLRCFVWVVLRLGDGWDGQREFAGPVIGGGSEVDEVLESSSHSLG
jgi:hypothetical protein